MTSFEIRQSFLDFFREKNHSIVASSSLLPDSPNLLFTNAGMNQFVPFFLGKASCPYDPARAANSQKCIRAGGKHNDLEDVGLDTYHHTFFEMLGNWSFGDYFKKEAILWAWELLVNRWKFPAQRLYATVYKPVEGDPSLFDEEAYTWWKQIFESQQLDPEKHIIFGSKKDNFWMMGETGPCGPCSEIHIDLTPNGDTAGKLVNQGDARCLEIWNLVFIQLNANPGGTFVPLPSRHVDTGMGFERVCSILQGTKNFKDFQDAKISNYNTDIFRPIFSGLEQLSGLKYQGTLPTAETTGTTEQQQVDIAFRVIADHARTLCLAIADGIMPGNEGRGYVLRRLLRRAARYGLTLRLERPFLYQLVEVVAGTLGNTYTDVEREQIRVEKAISVEEENFAQTLSRGMTLFLQTTQSMMLDDRTAVSGEEAFKLYDTYGFPLDLTQLMARERGYTVDEAGFDLCMNQQRQRSQSAQKKEEITVEGEGNAIEPTRFLGYDQLESEAKVILTDKGHLIVDQTPFYAEMGGQVGDTGEFIFNEQTHRITDTIKSPRGVFLHKLEQPINLIPGTPVKLRVNPERRARISAHHTATHLLHWALQEVLGPGVAQKGSYVAPDRFRFDFSHSQAVKQEELAKVQELLVEKLKASDLVAGEERAYADVKGDASILQFFGDKYGEFVRVVRIGDYSKELCGGTHASSTKDVGFIKVIAETSVAAGVRRIEAVAGEALTEYVVAEIDKQQTRWEEFKRRLPSIESLHGFSRSPQPRQNWQQLLRRQEQLFLLNAEVRAGEKEYARQRDADFQLRAGAEADSAVSQAGEMVDLPYLTYNSGEAPAAYLTHLADAIKKKWEGVAILGAHAEGRASLLVSVSPKFSDRAHAARIIDALAPVIGGKGGGKSALAQAGGDQPDNLVSALEQAPNHLFD